MSPSTNLNKEIKNDIKNPDLKYRGIKNLITAVLFWLFPWNNVICNTILIYKLFIQNTYTKLSHKSDLNCQLVLPKPGFQNKLSF